MVIIIITNVNLRNCPRAYFMPHQYQSECEILSLTVTVFSLPKFHKYTHHIVLKSETKSCLPCYVGPCHHGMARSHVAHGGYGLQLRRVTANTLNKQSRTADDGLPSRLGGG